MKFEEYTSSLDTLPVPEWIIAERYMYCDNFINDYTKTRHFDLLAFVKRLFRKSYALLFIKRTSVFLGCPFFYFYFFR